MEEKFHLAFETASGRFAVPADRVRRVVWLPVVEDRQPRIRGQVGVAEVFDEQLPIVDLDVAFDRDPEPYSMDHRLLDVDAGGEQLGLVATEVLDLVRLREEDRSEPFVPQEPIVAVAQLEAGRAEVLDPEALAALDPQAEASVEAADLFVAFDEEQRDELARRLGRLAPEGEPQPPARRAVLVRLAEDTMAVPVDAVEGFARLEGLTPVPHAPDRVLGLTTYRGDVATIVDPHGPLDLEPPEEPLGVAVLVAFPEGLAGIAVVEPGPTVAIEDGDPEPDGTRPGVVGTIEHEGSRVPLVDPFALLRSDRVVVGREIA